MILILRISLLAYCLQSNYVPAADCLGDQQKAIKSFLNSIKWN